MNTLTFVANDEADTDRLGNALASVADSGMVVGLTGTLGAGKTRFAQAIAAGFGVARQHVVSPTFVLCQEYEGRRKLYHLDAYRVRDDDEFLQLGVEEMFDSSAWILIEWADRVVDSLPSERLEVEITVLSDDRRQFLLTAYGRSATDLLARLRDFRSKT